MREVSECGAYLNAILIDLRNNFSRNVKLLQNKDKMRQISNQLWIYERY